MYVCVGAGLLVSASADRSGCANTDDWTLEGRGLGVHGYSGSEGRRGGYRSMELRDGEWANRYCFQWLFEYQRGGRCAAQATRIGNSTYATGAAAGSNQTSSFGFGSTRRRSCTVSIVMMNGTVSRVNYSGPTGGVLTKGEQCAYAVQNCPH